MLIFKPVLLVSLATIAVISFGGCLEIDESQTFGDMNPDAGDSCLKCHHTSDEYETCDDCHGAHGDSTAHDKHLNAKLWGQPVECKDCHLIPNGLFEGDHFNATVDVVFKEDSLASADGMDPYWNGMRCKNVYCHGASLTGGAYTEPAWQGEKENGITCGDCHGIPPNSPHPVQTDCATCHPSAYNDAGALDFKVHLNGLVNF